MQVGYLGLMKAINGFDPQVGTSELDGQCQQLLTLRFYGNLTQDEISRRLGVSQMQVSRLLRRTLDHLRGCLLPPPPGSTSASPGA